MIFIQIYMVIVSSVSSRNFLLRFFHSIHKVMEIIVVEMVNLGDPWIFLNVFSRVHGKRSKFGNHLLAAVNRFSTIIGFSGGSKKISLMSSLLFLIGRDLVNIITAVDFTLLSAGD